MKLGNHMQKGHELWGWWWRNGKDRPNHREECESQESRLHKRAIRTASVLGAGVVFQLLLQAVPALASPVEGLILGQPMVGGSGCPGDTVGATLSPDGNSLSLLFDNYQARVGGATRQSMDRKTCNISIPVTVPQGYSVSVINVDYRGFNSLPHGAQSTFSVEYFFAGSRGPEFSKTFRGPLQDTFLINNELIAQSSVWSACGAETTMRVNSSLFLQSNRSRDEAIASVDSADVSSAVIFQLSWKRCGNGGGIGGDDTDRRDDREDGGYGRDDGRDRRDTGQRTMPERPRSPRERQPSRRTTPVRRDQQRGGLGCHVAIDRGSLRQMMFQVIDNSSGRVLGEERTQAQAFDLMERLPRCRVGR